MRPSNLCTFLAAGILLLSACHKSGSATTGTTGITGEWHMIQLTGGPFIDVTPVDANNVYVMHLLADSTVQDYYNGRLTYQGTWSVKQSATPTNPAYTLSFSGTVGLRDTFTLYQVTLTKDKLVMRMLPETGYQATYTRH